MLQIQCSGHKQVRLTWKLPASTKCLLKVIPNLSVLSRRFCTQSPQTDHSKQIQKQALCEAERQHLEEKAETWQNNGGKSVYLEETHFPIEWWITLIKTKLVFRVLQVTCRYSWPLKRITWLREPGVDGWIITVAMEGNRTRRQAHIILAKPAV